MSWKFVEQIRRDRRHAALQMLAVPPGTATLCALPGTDLDRFVSSTNLQLTTLGPGDQVFVPRGTPHSFLSLGPEVGRQLIISSPGGIFDAFVAEVSNSRVDSGSPSRAGVAGDFRVIAARYGMEFLDPFA